MRPARLRQCRAEFLEVLTCEVGHKTSFAEGVDEVLAGGVVVAPRSWRQFAGIEKRFLGGEEAVDEVANCQPVALHARRSTGLQIVALFEVLGERSVRISTEVVHPATNLLRPLPCLV